MRLSEDTRAILTRSRRLLARGWTKSYLFKRNEQTNKPEYCLMGGILRSCGVAKEQMYYPEMGESFVKKGKVQLIIEWSQYPPEAKVAMKALAIVILEEVKDLGVDYIGDASFWYFLDSGLSPKEYLDQNEFDIPDVISEYNDYVLQDKADAKRILSRVLGD